MPQVIFAPAALRDLTRLREFLQQKNPPAAKRIASVIVKSLRAIEQQPQIGRPIEDAPDAFREWIINFGDSGYVARYRYSGGDTITILAIRHQKEVGFDA